MYLMSTFLTSLRLSYVEFEDTKGVTQWPKEKGQKYKQRSTKHTHKNNDTTRTPLKTGGELRGSGRVNSFSLFSK